MINPETLELILESKRKTIDLLREALQEAEEELDIYVNDVDPNFLRKKLSRWVDRVIFYCTRSLSTFYLDKENEGKSVYIPLRRDISTSSSAWNEQTGEFLEMLRTEHLVSLFGDEEDAKEIGMGEVPYLEMFLDEEEYKEILPTSDEEIWFYLCRIIIVRNGKITYGGHTTTS